MNSLMMYHQTERLILITAVFKPFQTLICNDICQIALFLMIISVGQNLYKSIKTPVEKWGEKA